MNQTFSGHLAVVTGGASGIGEQVCRDLAAEGASVVVIDRHEKSAMDMAASLPTGDGRQHLAIRVDVTRKADIDAAVALVASTYGRPADLIVNSAGVADGPAPLEDITEEHFDSVVNINYKGTWLVTQAFGRALLQANKPGSIVNVSSVLAWSCWEHMSHYCGSKAAVMQFSKVAAKEWGPKGIRVNTVHPGLTQTPLTEYMAGGAMWKAYASRASLRRVGTPKDVSDAILYLLSDKSAFVTGAHLEVSGQGF